AQHGSTGCLAHIHDSISTADVAPVARLLVNRRQRHPAERAALGALRAGAPAASQAIRRAQGWEHDHDAPAVTRQALAEAVVADIERHGPDDVVALAVSHAECEDLADRIRALLVDRGRLGVNVVTGPGWGLGERGYA